MPKNVLFSKNYRGRASSAVYRHNNGHASVARKLADVGCPLSRNAIKRLQSQQKNIKRARALQISGQYKKMRAMSRMRAAQDWIKRKIAVENRDHEYICSKTTSRVAARLSRSVEHDYCKGQNDPFQPQWTSCFFLYIHTTFYHTIQCYTMSHSNIWIYEINSKHVWTRLGRNE